MKKELSGFFLAPERFAAILQELRTSDAITRVRLFHNTSEHTEQLLQALATRSSLAQLEIGDLDAVGASALEVFLSDASSACRPTSLIVQQLTSQAAAAALGRGLASSNCAVQDLSLSGLTGDLLADVLTPIASNPVSALRVTALQLPLCTVSEAAAAAIGAMTQLQRLECILDDAALSAALQLPRTPVPTAPCQPGQQGQAQHACMRELRLERSQLTAAGAASLAAYMAHCPHLTHLLLAEVPLGDDGAVKLAEGVAGAKALMHLNLSQCNIGAEGASALAQALGQHPGLEEVIMDGNVLGGAGAGALLRALSTTVGAVQPAPPLKLRKLTLSACRVRGADLPADLASLQLCAPLTWVSLGRNQLMDVGAGAVVPLLATAAAAGAPTPGADTKTGGGEGVAGASLLHIDLKENGISEHGAAAVVSLLEAQQGLQELVMDGNRLHDVGAELMLAAVLAHPSLKKVCMQSCRVMSPFIKAKIQEVAVTLAERHRPPSDDGCTAAATNAGAANTQAARPIRMGSRFSPEVYQLHMQQMLQQNGAGGDAPDAAVPMESEPPAPVAVPAPGGVRKGRRFPPEIYMRAVEDEDEDRSSQGGAHKHVRDRSDGEDSGGLCPKGRKVTDLTGAACGQFACSGGGAAGLGLGSRSCGGGAEGGVRGGGGIRPSLDGCAAAVWGASGPRIHYHYRSAGPSARASYEDSRASDYSVSPCASSAVSSPRMSAAYRQHGMNGHHGVATITPPHPARLAAPSSGAPCGAVHQRYSVGSSSSARGGRRNKPLTPEQQRLFDDF